MPPPPGSTREIAALNPLCASKIRSFTPLRPHMISVRRKPDHKVSASDGPM